jgi:hypothetical protein
MFPPTCRSFFWLSYQNSLCIPFLTYAYYMPYPSHSSWLVHYNYISLRSPISDGWPETGREALQSAEGSAWLYRKKKWFWLLKYNAVQSVESQSIFRRVVSPPSSVLKSKWNKKSACFKLVSCFDYSPTLKMEASCSYETSVDFQWIAWRYMPEDRTLRNNLCQSFKSYIPKNDLGTEIIRLRISLIIVFSHQSIFRIIICNTLSHKN